MIPQTIHDPVAEALADFQGYVFSHPVAKETFTNLGAALGASSSPQIIIFTGPTGVGKSTLARAARIGCSSTTRSAWPWSRISCLW